MLRPRGWSSLIPGASALFKGKLQHPLQASMSGGPRDSLYRTNPSSTLPCKEM